MPDLIGPVTVANLTAAAGVVTTVDGWWPCLNLTWRTPVPASITRIVAQVREKSATGTTGTISETVVTPNDGAASIVNGVAVGQHLQVRLSPAGAPGLPFQPTPWVDVTTPWDALIAELDGLKLGCFTVVCGTGAPTRTDLPNGSLYIREDVSQLWRYVQDATVEVQGVNVASNVAGVPVTLSGLNPSDRLIVTKPAGLTYPAWSRWADGDPLAAGLPWSNDFWVTDADAVITHYWFGSLETDGDPTERYATEAAAEAAFATSSVTLTGSTSYTFDIQQHSPITDDRGGLSLVVTTQAPRWVLMSDLTEIDWEGSVVESAARSLNFTGNAVAVASDGAGRVTVTISGPSGTAITTEAITGPAACQLYASSGAKLRKASAADLTKRCNCIVVDAVGSGVAATYYLPGQWIPWAGLTPGATYYLDTTAGGITATAPSSAGNGVQLLGVANAAGDHLFFAPEPLTGV